MEEETSSFGDVLQSSLWRSGRSDAGRGSAGGHRGCSRCGLSATALLSVAAQPSQTAVVVRGSRCGENLAEMIAELGTWGGKGGGW